MPLNSPTDESPAGILYVAATPIGNLEDVTLRTLRVLGEVDFIVCEDTRHTRKLLTHHGISRPLVSCHDFNEQKQVPAIVRRLVAGESAALATDAGTPMVSDPGYLLVSFAVEAGIRVVPLPGPSAAVAALCASGLPAERFTFAGFMPKKAGARKKTLEDLASPSGAVVFYESPRRVANLVRELLSAWGDRRAVLARELTKIHEEMIRGTLSGIAEELAGRDEVRGECTLVVEGAGQAGAPEEMDLDAEIRTELERGSTVSEAASRVAKAMGRPRREVYQRALALQKDSHGGRGSSG